MLIGDILRDQDDGMVHIAERRWRAVRSRPLKIEVSPRRAAKKSPLIYASELAAPESQMVGWGLQVVIQEARRAGYAVEYVGHPPRARALPDVWLISLPYAGEAWRIAEFFEALGLPLDREARISATFILGGHGVANPEPFLEVFDGVFLGEADERIAEILAVAPDMDAMTAVPGLDTGRADHVVWQLAGGLERRCVYSANIDRDGIGKTKYFEVARGCRSKCRFCEVGWLYGYSERPRSEAEAMIAEHGRELVLSAPSTDGISWYSDLISAGGYDPRWRSTRVADYLRGRELRSSGRRKRLRFGVEGVTERLRKIAGKSISQIQLRCAIERGVREGYGMFRIFLIGGIPTETREERTEIVEILRILEESGVRHWKAAEIKITGLSPQPMTPWEWEPIWPALEALSDYRAWRSRYQTESPSWRSVLVDRQSTEADIIKRMHRGELIRYLSYRKFGEIEAPPDRRWEIIRAWCVAAGIDYDARISRLTSSPWSRVRHPLREIQDRARRAWTRMRSVAKCDKPPGSLLHSATRNPA